MLEYFKLQDGRIVKHYSELPLFLETLSENDFQSHVNGQKNDFAKWIYDVYGLSQLSNYLGAAKSKQESIRVLKAYLKMSEVKFQFKQPLTNQKQVSEEGKKIEEKPQIKNEITDADSYFKQNPVIVSQRVEAKKDTLIIEKINIQSYTGYETPDQLVSIFKDIYTKTYGSIVFLRKNGYDTKLIEAMLFRIPPKIKIFDASKENKDAETIKRYLNEVIEEINGIK